MLRIVIMCTLAIILLILHSSLAERDTAPVFLLDYEKVMSHISVDPNPFAKMQPTTFTKIVDEAKQRSQVVILFTEESLCFEDISLKDKHGTPFYHLSQGLKEHQVKYFPSVSQPFKTLKRLFQPEHFNVFYLSDSSTKLKVYDGRFKHLYIYFKDNLNETKATTLRRHDLLMREVYSVVRQIASGPITAFYTGKINTIATDKMNFAPVKSEKEDLRQGVTIMSESALFKFIGVYSTMGSRRSSFSQIPLVAEETWGKQRLATRMAYSDFELQFSFKFKNEGWIIENVALLEWGEEVGKTDMDVGAPWAWSFVCGEPLVVVNMRDGSSITISHYQIQPFNDSNALRDGSNNGTCFGPAVNCGPYFNVHILAGLMVSVICLGILSFGVTIMYGCESNSIYDDINGKPLTINAES